MAEDNSDDYGEKPGLDMNKIRKVVQLLSEADKYYNEAEYDKAKELYEKVKKIEPDNPEAIRGSMKCDIKNEFRKEFKKDSGKKKEDLRALEPILALPPARNVEPEVEILPPLANVNKEPETNTGIMPRPLKRIFRKEKTSYIKPLSHDFSELEITKTRPQTFPTRPYQRYTEMAKVRSRAEAERHVRASQEVGPLPTQQKAPKSARVSISRATVSMFGSPTFTRLKDKLLLFIFCIAGLAVSILWLNFLPFLWLGFFLLMFYFALKTKSQIYDEVKNKLMEDTGKNLSSNIQNRLATIASDARTLHMYDFDPFVIYSGVVRSGATPEEAISTIEKTFSKMKVDAKKELEVNKARRGY